MSHRLEREVEERNYEIAKKTHEEGRAHVAKLKRKVFDFFKKFLNLDLHTMQLLDEKVQKEC